MLAGKARVVLGRALNHSLQQAPDRAPARRTLAATTNARYSNQGPHVLFVQIFCSKSLGIE